MKNLTKVLFISTLTLFSSYSFSEMNELGIYYESEQDKAEGRAVIAKEIQEIKDFVARDNALTQKFVKEKNSKPFIDERDEFEQLEKLNIRLWAKQMDFGRKETVIEMIKAEQNFIENLDIKWNLAKERKYLDIKGAQPFFDEKRSDNETKLTKLKQKLANF